MSIYSVAESFHFLHDGVNHFGGLGVGLHYVTVWRCSRPTAKSSSAQHSTQFFVSFSHFSPAVFFCVSRGWELLFASVASVCACLC